ncbi:hypothetical protein ACIMRI_002776, partial [Enterococcus hirae]
PAIFFYYSTLFDSRFKTLQQNPEGRFFCFFFLVKKRKVLKVLWFWSALPTASQSTHFMNIKYSVLYFTWKWLPERAKMPHICAT